jgi:RTX calcium-binding nonapeptide repeat (4 copies)
MPLIHSDQTFTLDGTADFTVGGTTQSWGNGYFESLNIFSDDPAPASYTVTATLAGSNWGMGRFAIGGDSGAGTIVKAVINDSATGSNRYIEVLGLFGLGGNEVTLNHTQVASIMGSDGGADTITSNTSWVGSIQLFGGNDSVTVTAGTVETINLGNGNNSFTLTGGWVSTVIAFDGNDTVTLNGGSVDNINLGNGANSLTSTDGFVGALIAYDGNDTVNIGAAGADMINVGRGNNTVTTGTGKVSAIVAHDGNDTVTIGSGGADLVSLGLGNDVYNLGSSQPVIFDAGGVDLITTTISRDLGNFPTIENLTLLGVAAVNGTGNALNNIIKGNSAANTLNGGGGNDTLSGLAGNDILIGGAGKDTLTGGLGKDTFVFNTPLSASTNVDAITDFSHVDDTIQLSKAIFKGMGSGALLSKYFYAGTKAHDADDHIIYNKATGALYYDSDGTGAHAQVQFATISNHATAGLAYNDFVLI